MENILKLKIFIQIMIITLLLNFNPIKTSTKQIDNLSFIKYTYIICSTKKPTVKKKVQKKKVASIKNSNGPTYIKKFLEEFYPLCKQISERSNIPIEIILGQAALESGYGRSDASKNRNNYFGIRKGNKYISYEGRYESFIHYEKIITSKRYKTLFKLESYTQWPYELKRIGYAEDKEYPKRLLLVIQTLKKYGKEYLG